MVDTVPHRPKEAEALDIDGLNQFRMLKKYFNAKYMGKKVELRRSPSGEGYHIWCIPPLTLYEAYILGDCRGRLRYWEMQGYTFTFNETRNFWGRLTGREEEENPLALPFNLKISRGVFKWINKKRKRRRKK